MFSFIEPLLELQGFHASWIPRQASVDVLGDREFALRNLAPHHDRLIAESFPKISTRHHAEQIHGNQIAAITKISDQAILQHAGVDGLITNLPGQLLAIYVADCAAIYLADPVTRSIGLLHSGKKGTEGNILREAVLEMQNRYGTKPGDLVCVVSPCIRPPDYDVDFAETIRQQASELGIVKFHDSCQNTAADLEVHYSYRIEKGQTGRMLALLALQ
ncbi:MAG: laccase domain-containing protein [Verrucomicrobiota bacterium]